MEIKRISQITNLEYVKCSSMVLHHNVSEKVSDADEIKHYTLEIVSSTIPMNSGGQKKIHSTLAIYDGEKRVYYEIYVETLTPEQIREAQMNVSNNLSIYLSRNTTLIPN